MSDTVTKILHEAEGHPTIVEVPLGFTAVVFDADGQLDLALVPADDELPREEHTGEALANEGMMSFMGLLMALQNPEVRAYIEHKVNHQDVPQA
jgi:hypothetical protein